MIEQGHFGFNFAQAMVHLLLLRPNPWPPKAPMPPRLWPAKPPCKNGWGMGGPMIGSWLTLILIGIGNGRGIGAKPKPGGDSNAAAISSLTNFLAKISCGPQWTRWVSRDTLRTMANMNDSCDVFILTDRFKFLSSIVRKILMVFDLQSVVRKPIQLGLLSIYYYYYQWQIKWID